MGKAGVFRNYGMIDYIKIKVFRNNPTILGFSMEIFHRLAFTKESWYRGHPQITNKPLKNRDKYSS